MPLGEVVLLRYHNILQLRKSLNCPAALSTEKTNGTGVGVVVVSVFKLQAQKVMRTIIHHVTGS